MTGFRRFQFIDDQITGKHKFAKELFARTGAAEYPLLMPVDGQFEPRRGMLELAAKAGMFHVNIGVESISQDSLLSMNKIQNHTKEYKKLLKKMSITASTTRSISCSAWKTTIRQIFEDTLKFLHEVKAPEAFFNTVTPRKGTPMRTQLEDEGRVIIPDADMYTNNFRCMFVPKNLSPMEVEEGVWRCTTEFYSLKSMFKRLLLPPGPFTWQGLTENMLFYFGAKRQHRPGRLLLSRLSRFSPGLFSSPTLVRGRGFLVAKARSGPALPDSRAGEEGRGPRLPILLIRQATDML